MVDFITSFLVGTLGGELAHEINKKDKALNLTPKHLFILFCLLFTSLYTVGIIFFWLVSLIRHFPIPWAELGLFSMFFSILVNLVIFCFDKINSKK